MDCRAQKLVLFLFLINFLTACGEPDLAEKLLPNTKETCGGSAITNRYIVHYKDGRWDYQNSENRESFKENYVKPAAQDIHFIEYDQKIRLNSESIQPAASSGVDNWGADAIQAPHAWSKNYRGQNVIVAVIDTGVDVDHDQLQSQIYFNDGESGDKKNNGIDDDQNGYVDDYAGFNFYDNSNNAKDDEGHGTHVSGIIAAAHQDTTIKTGYVQGVAPEAKILPVKFLGQDGGTLSAAMKGIDYAVARGASIINASWGGPGCSQSLEQKMIELGNKNILMVVAAGNSGVNLDRSPEYPAAYNSPLQITVGAITRLLNMDFYSNYSANSVHLFAPGSGIVSTMPDDGYAAMSGTSMAAPFVSGAAAVILSAHPDLTLTQIRRELLGLVQTHPDYINTTHGRLSLGAL